jgi:hypothetical protein
MNDSIVGIAVLKMLCWEYDEKHVLADS